MRRERRAKIVATLGPSSSDRETIRKLFLAGADIFRLNFSHGTREDHAERHAIIRDIERELGRPIGILLDLQGPKIRLGTFSCGPFELEAGQKVKVVLEESSDAPDTLPLNHPEVFDAIAPGHPLLINDGRVRLDIKRCTATEMEASVVAGGPVSDRKGVNLPGTMLQLSPLTDKDREDLEFGLKLGADWVALSFVQQPSDVIEARQVVANRAGLMAKIEKPAALNHIEEITALVDSIMVARGDLGVEIAPEEVPGWQKRLVRTCRLSGKPVIIATQMLESMVHSASPTRAEASDVATAVYDGADAVMLSAESAAGDYPVEAVAMMDRIAKQTEQDSSYRSIINALQPDIEPTPAHSLSAAAAQVANEIGAAAIVAFTSSGATAFRIARKRPEVPVISLTPNGNVARRLSLLWGAHSVQSEDISSHREMVVRAAEIAKQEGFAKTGDQIVITAGVPFGQPGTTNNLRVTKV